MHNTMKKHFLVKFSSKEFLEPLQKEGLFYCKDIKYFSELEDGQVRGDNFESVIDLQYLGDALIQLRPLDKPDADWVDMKSNNVQFKSHNLNPLGNLFCMSALNVEVNNDSILYTFNVRFNEFGTHFLLIENDVIFLERLRSALVRLNLNYKLDRVKYLDLKKYSGKKSIFHKHNEYSWQEELRLHLETGICEPFEFSIGSLEDISTLYELKENPSLHIEFVKSTT